MAIVMILILGLALRLVNLNQSLWLDEAVQVMTSQGSLMGIFGELKGDFHPPLYHLLMWLWGRMFGYSGVSMRMPSVLFGAGTIYLVYLIAKTFLFTDFTKGVGRLSPLRCFYTYAFGRLPVIAGFLMAISPFHIYYSQEARMYSMAAFLASLSIYWFIKLVGNWRSGALIGYLVSTILLVYADYYGFLILLAQNIIVLIRYRLCSDVSRRYKKWLGMQLVLLVLLLPWLPMFLTQLEIGTQAVTSLPGWGKLVNASFLKALPLTFIKFIIGRITIFDKKLYALVAGILFLVYGGIIAKAIGSQYLAIRNRKKLDPGFFTSKVKFADTLEVFVILTWLLVPILFTWLVSLFVPNYQPFRLLLALPAFYLLLAIGIFKISTTMIRIIVVALVLGVSLISLSVYYFNPYFYREDWRGLAGFIESQKEAVTLLPSETSNWPWRYYSSGGVDLISVSSGVKPVSREDLENLNVEEFDSGRVYYIRYLVPLFDAQEKIDFWLKEQGFAKIKEISFNQIPVWQYEKR